jgi:hypothetical protein
MPAGNFSNETVRLDIIDITGRLTYSATLTGKTIYREELTLPSGMYFAKLKGKNINGVKNFVVE